MKLVSKRHRLQHIVDQSTRALIQYAKGDRDGAIRTLNALYDKYGAEAPPLAVKLWCREYLYHATGDYKPQPEMMLMSIRPQDGSFVDRQRLTTEQTWAIRLLEAHAQGDREAYGNVSDELLAWPDEEVHGVYMEALLKIVSDALTSRPPGYAKAGQQ